MNPQVDDARVVASCVDRLVNSGKGQALWSQLSQTTREALRRLDDRGAAPMAPAEDAVRNRGAAQTVPAEDDAVRTKKPRGERCRSRLTRLPPDVLRVVLSYRNLPTRYACASASRTLRDTVARLPLGPERCLAQRRYPLLATVCDVASLDAKTLGGVVRSLMDVTPIVSVGERGSFPPAHAAAVEAHTFHLELTAEGANAPLFLGTAEWDQDGFRDIGWDEEEGVYQVTFSHTDWSLSGQVRELITGYDTNIRARVMVTRRVNGGFQCSMLADRELRTLFDDDDTGRLVELYGVASVQHNDTMRDLEISRMIDSLCAATSFMYEPYMPGRGFSLKFSVIAEKADEEDWDFDTTDMARFLNHYVSWSRHVADVPPLLRHGLLMSPYEHMSVYARNAGRTGDRTGMSV